MPSPSQFSSHYQLRNELTLIRASLQRFSPARRVSSEVVCFRMRCTASLGASHESTASMCSRAPTWSVGHVTSQQNGCCPLQQIPQAQRPSEKCTNSEVVQNGIKWYKPVSGKLLVFQCSRSRLQGVCVCVRAHVPVPPACGCSRVACPCMSTNKCMVFSRMESSYPDLFPIRLVTYFPWS